KSFKINDIQISNRNKNAGSEFPATRWLRIRQRSTYHVIGLTNFKFQISNFRFSMEMMQDWANLGIETAKLRGATYADARVMDIRQRDISTKNGEVGTLLESETLGIGIRVVASGAWGFASTDRLTR